MSFSSSSANAFDAVVFDMDGVVTRTAEVHARAWRELFEAYLAARPELRPFSFPADYLEHIDGRPRYDGVAALLASRGVVLPRGTTDDAPGEDTVCALGNRKNVLFNRLIATDGVGVFESTLAFIAELEKRGVRIGLATSSRNAALVLERSGTARHFAAVIDGLVAEKRGLAGKPAPDIFVAACRDLGVAPERTVVVEDAAAGVAAGVRGEFAYVIGLAREGNAAELRAAGAHLVLRDLAEIELPELENRVLARRALKT